MFWQGTDGDLYEAWHDDRWHGPLDTGWPTFSVPSVAVGNNGHQYVFWQGLDGTLEEAWYTDRWHGPLDSGWRSNSAPAVAVNPVSDQQYLYWQQSDGRIDETWTNGPRWQRPLAMPWRSGSAPAVAVSDQGERQLAWQGADTDLRAAVYTAEGWHPPLDTDWAIHTPQPIGCVPAGDSLVYHGPFVRREIALTFDDGPWYDTAQFLDVLEREHVPATFFQIGEQIAIYGRDVERRMLSDGDMIGDHTWSHPDISRDRVFAADQIERAAAAIRHATGGFRPCLLRAPYGSVSPKLITEARALGFITIQWDVDPSDYTSPGADAIYDRVIDHAHNGAIIIQHDGGGDRDRSQTLAALPREIDTLRSQGYRLVTIPQLLGLRLLHR